MSGDFKRKILYRNVELQCRVERLSILGQATLTLISTSTQDGIQLCLAVRMDQGHHPKQVGKMHIGI